MEKLTTFYKYFMVLILFAGMSTNVWAEHLPLSGKSYTIGNGSATDWTHKYETLSFTGVPDKLSFNYAYIYTAQSNIGNPTLSFDQLSGFAQGALFWVSDSKKGHGNTHMLYIEESANGTNWTTIWTDDNATNKDTHASGDIQLSKSTRYIRFHHSCNFSNSYTNIKVTELKYVEDPEPATLDFGSAVINSGEVTKTSLINWCNISPLTVNCSNARFTVTPASFGGVDTYGSQTLTVSYTHTNETGLNEGDITISNDTYSKTIHVKANTTKRPQTIEWNADLAATGFAMNTEEQYPDATIAYIATSTSGGRITFTSDNSDVIEVIADTALLAKTVGTVNITAHQAGDAEYNEVSDTKLFTVTELLKQSISWDQNLYGLLTTSGSVELTATATSGGPITYTSANSNVVKVEGNVLTVVGEGETYITASQAGGTIDGHEYLSVSQNNYVVVRNPASQCNGMALSLSSLTLNGSKMHQDYNLSGIPAVLTFTAKHGTKNNSTWGSATYSALIVEQYIYQEGLWDWHEVYNQVVGTSDTQSGNITLDETATKLRFRTLETGTDHTISNIRVSRAKFLRANIQAIDENAEANATWSKTITVSHSNIDLMTISTEKGLLSLSQTTLGEGCGDFGDDAFTVSFTPHEKNVEYNDVIVITDSKASPSTVTIPVHITSTGLHQTINDFALPAEALTTAEIPAFAATATSGLEVVYISSDSTVAYVENNRLVVLSAGTVAITAYQAGDEKYDPASDTKTITLSLTPVEITVAPTASALVVGESLAQSVLTGGEASVAGTFAWQDETITPEEGEQAYTVLFTPDNTAIYATATVNVTVQTTFTKHDQSIVWNDEIPEMYPNRTFDITAYSTAGLEVSFVSSDSAIAYVENNQLRTLAVGEVTITAVQEGNEFYNAAVTVAKTVKVVRIPDAYGDYTITICEGDSAEFRGVWYKEAGTTNVLLEEKNLLGGDSIVLLTVGFYPVYLKEETMEIYAGTDTTWQGHDLSEIFPVADTTIVSEYKSLNDCDSTYTLHLTVLAPTRHGVYDAAICKGDSVEYEGKWYHGATQEEVTLAQKNYYGGDSVVTLTVAVHPVYAFNEEMTMYAGADSVWQKKNLSELTVGDTTIVAEYKTIHGCDSTYTLLLHVLTPPTHYGELNVSLCSGERYEFEGKTYKKTTTATVVLAQKNMYGGDSIVELTVNVYPKMLMESSMTIIIGTDTTWENIDLSVLPVGDTTLVAAYKSIHDCDSTYTLYLTVEPVPTAYGEYEASFCEGDSVEYAGTWYYETTKTEILLDEKSTLGGDSIVRLTVTVHPVESTEETRQIMLGTQEIWNEIDFSALPLGDTTLVAKGTTAYGCDSTHTLYLTVVKNTATAIDQTQADLQPAAAKELRNGLIYIRKGDDLYDVCGRKVETVRL
ncbi:MAG: hypothetical protein J6M55_05960 [Paludibacteraceae bacterium]|nr:hypothetical protein [Paludibacteraceae bacterium]